MRLLQRKDAYLSGKYGQTIRRIQKLANGYRDITYRAHEHISNHHKGLLAVQIEELQKVISILNESLVFVEESMQNRNIKNFETVIDKNLELRALADELNLNQIERIRNGESKTRLSILFYSIVGNAIMISKQNMKLMENFAEAFGSIENIDVPDHDSSDM
jgi:Na+/phosphate symporter